MFMVAPYPTLIGVWLMDGRHGNFIFASQAPLIDGLWAECFKMKQGPF
jgi:hypothetical protein